MSASMASDTAAPDSVAPHPLESTLAAGAQLGEWYAAALGREGRPLAEVAQDESALLAAIEAQCARYETNHRRVGASFLLGNVAWRLVGSLGAAYLQASRVPVLDAGRVALRFDSNGQPAPASFDPAHFYVLPDDPDAGHPAAAVCPDRPALRAAFRKTVDDTLSAFVLALAPWSRRAERTQWLEVSDAVANVFRSVGEALDCDDYARTEAERILDGTPPFTGQATWIHLEHQGAVRTLHRRSSCCMAYLLEDYGYCLSCPLEDEENREVRWRERLRDQAQSA